MNKKIEHYVIYTNKTNECEILLNDDIKDIDTIIKINNLINKEKKMTFFTSLNIETSKKKNEYRALNKLLGEI